MQQDQRGCFSGGNHVAADDGLPGAGRSNQHPLFVTQQVTRCLPLERSEHPPELHIYPLRGTPLIHDG